MPEEFPDVIDLASVAIMNLIPIVIQSLQFGPSLPIRGKDCFINQPGGFSHQARDVNQCLAIIDN